MTPWRLAVAACLAAAGLVVAGAGLALSGPSIAAVAWLAAGAVVGGLWAGLGLFVARREPANRVGAIMAVVGANVAFVAVREVGWEVLVVRWPTAGWAPWVAAALRESAVWLLVALALLLLHLPDGRLPGPRYRAVPAVLVTTAALHHAAGVVDPAPFRPPLEDLARPLGPLPPLVQFWSGVAFVVLVGALVASAASMVGRYRKADRTGRSQLRWVALAGLGVPGFIVACLAEIAVIGEPFWFSVAVGVVAIVGAPLAVAVAIAYHDLYDVDRALSATVTYAVVTSALVGLYATATFASGVVLGRDSAVAAAGVTAVGAVALTPVRRRVQQRVDQRLHPLRLAAVSAVGDLQRRVHAGSARPEQLDDELRAALGDPGLRVGYTVPGRQGPVSCDGRPVDPSGGVPVLLGTAPIGVLVPGPDGAGRHDLRPVAEACATLVEVVRLRLELTAALREVEASKARLVRVGDEERRRLERDLHDGAQQRLVSLGMALRLAQRHLDDGTVDVEDLLDRAVAELGIAVGELRRVAHCLRPRVLDRGLPAALDDLTRQVPVPVQLEVVDAPLPDPVVATLYYVASEALANACKHADADRLSVRVRRRDGQVVLRVCDNGRGGADPGGSGLTGVADRVVAVGGSLRIESPPGRGTVVEAVIPCGS
jgi:signal transduction histidine kinase